MKCLAAPLLALFVSPVAIAQTPAPSDFAYTLPLELTPGSALYAVRVPATVYARSVRPALGDVRVFNGAREPVPHALRLPAAAPSTEPAGTSLPIFPLGAAHATAGTPDALEIRIGRAGALMRIQSARRETTAIPARYVIDASRLDGEIAFLAISFARADADVFARADVEASDDLRHWRSVIQAAPLVQMHFNGAELRETRIPLDNTRAKYLRLTGAGDGFTARITRIEAIPPKTLGSRPRESVVVAGTRGEREGEYLYETRGTYPADRVFIEPAADNTVMPFELDGRDAPSAPWLPVAHGTAYRLLNQGVRLASASFPISGPWHRTYRLRFTAAPIPSSAPVLRFEWTPADIVFAAQGTPPFLLAYGQAGARDAALPVTTLVPGMGTKSEVKPVEARAGIETPSAGDAAMAARPDYGKWGLWGVMGLGAVVIGGIALRLIRDAGKQ